MKKNSTLIVGLYIGLLSSAIHAEDKNQSVGAQKVDSAKSTVLAQKTVKLDLSDVLGDENIQIDARIGFIDSFAVMGECKQGQKARNEIETKRDFATKDIQEDSKRIEKAKNDYVSKSTAMSDSAREKEEKKLIKMDRDLKNLVAEKEEELKLDMQIATEKLAHDMDEGVVELAKRENLDIVFDKMTGRAVYVSEKYDFTDKAIDQVNKKYEIKLAQAKQVDSAAFKVADNKAASAQPAKVGA